MRVPPPPADVADWPVIGDRLHELWTLASEDPEAMLGRFGPEVMGFGSWLLSTLAGFGVAFLMTIVSIIIAGVMLIHAEAGARTMRAIGARVGGAQGESAVTLATQAIRSVATGVIGVAAVQAVLAAAGLFVADVPAAALWAGLVLILAVAQLPPLIILGPAIVYVMATSDSTLIKVLFTIWSVLVSFSDVLPQADVPRAGHEDPDAGHPHRGDRRHDAGRHHRTVRRRRRHGRRLRDLHDVDGAGQGRSGRSRIGSEALTRSSDARCRCRRLPPSSQSCH